MRADSSEFPVELTITQIAGQNPPLFTAYLRDITDRKEAEKELSKSLELLRKITEGTPDPVFAKDTQGRYVLINTAGARFVGKSSADVIGLDDTALFSAETAARIMERDRSVIEDGETRTDEDIMTTASGLFRVHLTTKGPLRDSSGAITGLFGISRDITQSKRADEALKREKEVLTKIFNNIPVMIGFVGTDRTVSFVNPEWERTIGWTLKELREQNVDIFAEAYPDPAYRSKVLEFVEAATGEWADLKIKVRDGRVIDASCAIVHLSDGTKVAIAQDITEQKRAQEAVRASEERFRLLAEVTNDAIWDWDLVTNELWWNEGFELLFGYNRGEIEKTIDSWYNRIHPADRGRVVTGIHRVIDEGGITWSDEYRFLCKDGSYAYVLDRGHVIRNGDGYAARMVGGMRDLTERKEAEAAIQALPAELLRAQDEERRRIARELHDSTAQELAVVAMNLGRLEEWIEGRDPWAENLLADSLAVLTQGNRDLRTLAHLLHPPMLEELGLIGAIRDYVEGFSARSGVEVDLEFPDQLDRCPEEIETAVFRLVQESLSNVHRHSGSKSASVRLKRADSILEVTISDSGRGLPRGLLTGTSNHARVGVGISGMRQRIIQLQGRFEIASREGRTTVSAVLPFPKKVVSPGNEGAV